MTVAELIIKLQEMPQEAVVVVYDGTGEWESPDIDVRRDITIWPTPYREGMERIAIPLAVVIA